MRSFTKSLVLVAAAAHLAVAPLAYSSHSFAASGDLKLPNPYVSRAFDAVLLPIDDTVRTTFKLSPKDTGVLVLSVEPGGVADKQGIEPGDVLYQIKGHKVTTPIELDEVVYYWIGQGIFDFGFDYYRNGVIARGTSNITLDLYNAVIDIAAIAGWSAWSVDSSFSYSNFYSEYSEEISTSYESSETTIEETTTSEEFTSEVTTESTEETTSEETTTDSTSTEEEKPALDATPAEDTTPAEDATPAEEATPAEDVTPTDAADDGVESPAEAETTDTDGDGIMDAEDTDDDGDGVSDADDTDDDGDGVDDAEDPDAGGDDE